MVRERCMTLSAQIAVKRHKFPSNPQRVNQYTAENVTRNIGDIEIT